MSRLDEIEARLNLLEWGDEHQQASVIDAIPADLRALLAVARAAEIVRTIVLHDGQKPNVTFELYDAYKVLFGALDALDAKEADGETTTTTD